ncbi:MAG: aryl-sulfate sulfotransferase, partial [Rhodanobacteraceae bacterium]
MRKLLLVAVCVFAAYLLPISAFAALQVQLTPSVASPQPTGTAVNLVAAASDSNPGILTYRYSISGRGISRIVRDYSQDNGFDWAGTVNDGTYVVQVTVRNNSTQETAQNSLLFRLNSRVAGGMPVVTASANPLVALFSAPACARGSKIRVRFVALGNPPDVTDWRACDPASSSNIYVAGMRENTRYSMAAQVRGRSGITTGPTRSFRTGSVPANFPVVTPIVPADSNSSKTDDVLLSDYLSIGTSVGYPVATDLSGRPIWYYAGFNDPAQAGGLLTRILPHGTILVLANGTNSSDATTAGQILREIDLAGNTLRETNASRLREQLNGMGLVSNCTTGGSVCAVTEFHHDAIRLPNGHTIVFGSEERMYPAGTQGATAPVDILGDIAIDLDENFQVAWYWDSFAHMDVNRAAILGETCTPGFQACPPQYLASSSNDWLHTNAVQYTSDHNLVISMRHQDWVIKVNYQDGTGNGNVIWRLGPDGDFSIVSDDPYPWFTHQHDAGFESDGTFTVFDDGNTRVFDNPGVTENSRGQVYQVDEVNKVATLLVNSDLGVYSAALGSAQLLSNGNYHFLPGFNQPGPTQFSQS